MPPKKEPVYWEAIRPCSIHAVMKVTIKQTILLLIQVNFASQFNNKDDQGLIYIQNVALT